METLDNIKKAAEEIRDASQPGENTAAKVGGVLVGLAEHIGNGGSVAPAKRKKLKWRRVARRSVRLGATVEKGNPVKYWGTNHQIVLKHNTRYKLYVNGEALQKMWEKSTNIQYSVALRENATFLRRFDDGSFVINNEYYERICVPVGYENKEFKKSFMYVDKVVTDGDITEVYLVREIPSVVENVNFDNGNKYYYVRNGYVEPKNVLISKSLYTSPAEYGIDVAKYGSNSGKYVIKTFVERKINLRSNNKNNGFTKRGLIRLRGYSNYTHRAGRVFVVIVVKGLSLPPIELQRRYRDRSFVLLSYR